MFLLFDSALMNSNVNVSRTDKKCKTTLLFCSFRCCQPLLSKRLNWLIKRTYIIMIIMVLVVTTDEIWEVVVGAVINGWGEISRTGGHRQVIVLHWPLNWRLWWVDFTCNSSISSSNSSFIGQIMENSYPRMPADHIKLNMRYMCSQ